MRLRTKIWLVSLLVMLSTSLPSLVLADNLGDTNSFFADITYDAFGRNQITASLRHISVHAYFYIEDEVWNNFSTIEREQYLTFAKELATEFDNRIYPLETSFFGSEPNPGVDNDPRVTIVLSNLRSSIGGYFNTGNEYRQTDSAYSNQREMFFLNAYISSHRRLSAFLAHEFQHMISFNQKEIIRHTPEDVWLNELRSEYAVTLLGYNEPYQGSTLERRTFVFSATPSDSLTEWKNESPDYAQVTLFGEFLAEKYGPQIIAGTLKNSSSGMASLDDALASFGLTIRHEDVFANWLYEIYLNDTLKIPPTRVVTGLGDTAPVSIEDQVIDWQGRWYILSDFAYGNNANLVIDFSSPSLLSFRVPYIIFYKDDRAELKNFYPSNANKTIFISDIMANIDRIVIMPFKKDKLSGFSSNEIGTAFSMLISRTSADAVQPPTLESLNLHEGDFIRAEGDQDVYIINSFGYKRIVLNSSICLLYRHLGDRGCFSAVKIVSPDVRDSFKTSNFYTNGETNNGVIYELQLIDNDHGRLVKIANNFAEFEKQQKSSAEIFQINSAEQRQYR